MMDVDIINLDGAEDFERIDATLRRLIGSVAGTIPGSRSFGLENGAVNLTPEEARNEFAMELDEKVEEYLPEIAIENIEVEAASEGSINLRVYVATNEEDEDD